ncbi:MAG: sugar phosphate isomerase/epimerase family protein [Paracoccaceae bacterium]
MTLRYAYNTNGCAHHRLEDAVALIADAGYDGIALTLDFQHLDPYRPGWERHAERLGTDLARRGMGTVVETGARFLLDPAIKHEPTLVSPTLEGRMRRVDFLGRAIRVAAIMRAEAVSFWAGVPRPGVDPAQAWDWLRVGIEQVSALAETEGVVLALEPEPGMLIETVDDYARLCAGLGRSAPRLALDTGHCLVTGERDPAAAVREFAPCLGTVSIEDMKRGKHLHLPFGTGDMDMPSVLGALRDVAFDGLACVELSRESPRADRAIPEAIDWLRACEAALPPLGSPLTAAAE